MSRKMKNNVIKGFTLIEVSMVLIILAFFTAGITTGVHLIRASELRSVITDVNEYKIVIANFQAKFHDLPGDFDIAQSYWPSNCSDDGANSCNGNSDNLVFPANTEGLRAWQHLTLSDMLPNTYTGILDKSYTSIFNQERYQKFRFSDMIVSSAYAGSDSDSDSSDSSDSDSSDSSDSDSSDSSDSDSSDSSDSDSSDSSDSDSSDSSDSDSSDSSDSDSSDSSDSDSSDSSDSDSKKGCSSSSNDSSDGSDGSDSSDSDGSDSSDSDSSDSSDSDGSDSSDSDSSDSSDSDGSDSSDSDGSDSSDSDSSDSSDSDNNGQEKVTICHNGHDITVAIPSVINAHLNHGDSIGSCEASDDSDSKEEDECDDETSSNYSGKYTIGVNVPASQIQKSGYKIDWDDGLIITFATERPPYLDGAAISSFEAWELDMKTDDGIAEKGNVKSSDAYGSSSCISGGEYSMDNDKVSCQIHFRVFNEEI